MKLKIYNLLVLNLINVSFKKNRSKLSSEFLLWILLWNRRYKFQIGIVTFSYTVLNYLYSGEQKTSYAYIYALRNTHHILMLRQIKYVKHELTNCHLKQGNTVAVCVRYWK